MGLRAESHQSYKLVGDWESGSRDGRTYRVFVKLRDARLEEDRLFAEVTTISGTAISTKYGRELSDDLPEIESLTFSKAKARLALGLYEQGKDYIQEITSTNINPEAKNMSDDQVKQIILQSLANLRKSDPTRYKFGQIDIDGFCQILGIDNNSYLFNASVLLEDGFIGHGHVDQLTINTGGMYITSSGIRYLGNLKQQRPQDISTSEVASIREEDIFRRDYEYDVAISFAGEDRKIAEELALGLQGKGIRVFYDAFEQDKLWGKNLLEYFEEVFRNRAKFCVMLLSKNYASKSWTNHERRMAQARAFRDNGEYILPIKIDNTQIPGILETIGYITYGSMPVERIIELIIKKLSAIA